MFSPRRLLPLHPFLQTGPMILTLRLSSRSQSIGPTSVVAFRSEFFGFGLLPGSIPGQCMTFLLVFGLLPGSIPVLVFGLQVMPAGGGRSGNTLLQRVTERPGANKWAGNLDNPLTALGNPTAKAPIKITVDVRAPKAAFVNSTPDAISHGRSAAAAPPSFKYQAGRINGGGLKGSPFMATLEEAEAACIANTKCNAITFESTEKNPKKKASMWLTSLTTVGQQNGWQSYLIDPPRPVPPPPPPPLADPLGAWLGVCGRVTEIGQNRNMGGTSQGVCLQLNATTPTGGASWRLEEDGTKILSSGECSDCSLSEWISLELDFTVDGKVAGSVNGKAIDAVDTNATAGMIALTTGWHVGEFDNFKAKSQAKSWSV